MGVKNKMTKKLMGYDFSFFKKFADEQRKKSKKIKSIFGGKK